MPRGERIVIFLLRARMQAFGVEFKVTADEETGTSS